ncbi:hypothetical protein D3C75_995830 [compost metagenome]
MLSSATVLASISSMGSSTVKREALKVGRLASSRALMSAKAAGTSLNGIRLPSSLRNRGPPTREAKSPTARP